MVEALCNAIKGHWLLLYGVPKLNWEADYGLVAAFSSGDCYSPISKVLCAIRI